MGRTSETNIATLAVVSYIILELVASNHILLKIKVSAMLSDDSRWQTKIKAGISQI